MPAVQPTNSLPGRATSDSESGSDAFEEEDAPITEGRLEPGAIVRDTYRIDALIAVGGMGDVYRATHLRLQGQVALKLLHRALLTDGEAVTRFRNEATTMASLHHPHIAQVFDFNVLPDGTPFLVMELAKGQDLRTVLSNQRVLAPARVAHIVRQTAAALGAAHAQGIIHRDLKPENVMLVDLAAQGDCVKVVDFGISKQGPQSCLTVPSVVIGTPAYMAPEQARGLNEEIDHRTDQFGLAAMAYTLFTGHDPFRAATAVAVLYQVVHETTSPLRQFVDWPCTRTEAVLQRALAKDRHDRFPDILAFAYALEDAVALDLAGDAAIPCASPALETPPSQRALALAPTADREADAEAALVATAPLGIPVRRPRARRRGHAGWRRALLIAGAAAAMAIGVQRNAEQGLRAGPDRMVRACGALSKGAAHLLEFARMPRPTAARDALNPPGAAATAGLLSQ